MLYDFHVNPNDLSRWVNLLGFKVRKGVIMYLDAYISSSSKFVKFLDPLVRKM